MTRKWFLSLIGIGAAGQEMISIKRSKPANGECPVCGTKAPPYRRKMVSSGFMTNCRPVPNTWSVECDQPKHWDGPGTITISCSHCRAHFSQDAEAPK